MTGVALPPQHPGRGHRTMVTAKDVARAAGVHQSTVSRALDPAQRDRVSLPTRMRVEAAARQLDYQPDLVARNLRQQRSMTVGVIIPSFVNPVYGALVRGINAELERHDYHALVIETPDGHGRLSPALAAFQGRRVDGIICASAHHADEPVLARVVASGLPLVLTLRWIEGTEWPGVRNDDIGGGALAAEHLISLGHRVLAELPGPLGVSSFPERSQGFREAAAAAGATVVDVASRARDPNVEEGRRIADDLLDAAGDSVTGIFAHNDLLAIGAIGAMARRGLRCPRDISVVGYNDSPLTQYVEPALSTIRMPVDAMGRAAARRVLALIDGGTLDQPVITLPPRLIPRASTAAARR